MSRPDLLKRRALNRATLARQLLLRRSDRIVSETLEHLVGMQAQAPDAPYVGLWSRLQDFRTDDLSRLIAERGAVRVPLLRATVHLVTASDCLAIRPVVQTVLAKSFAGQAFARNLAGLDLAAVLDAATGFLEQCPRTRSDLGACLAAHWPGYDRASLAQAVAYLLPVVHVPPRGMWRERGPVALTSVESWLGRSLDADPRPDKLILRYLAAFGPATVRDIQRWSGLTRLHEVTERLRPALRIFRSEAGAELFDLPDAPRPDPATPAPPRFLPEYDNLLLSHDDRGRFIHDGRRVPLPPGNGGTMGTLLVNGDFEATWRVTRHNDIATLTVQPFGRLSPSDTQAIASEGARLLGFIAADATPDVVVTTSPERRSREHVPSV